MLFSYLKLYHEYLSVPVNIDGYHHFQYIHLIHCEMYNNLFPQFPDSRHLGGFQLSTITNSCFI